MNKEGLRSIVSAAALGAAFAVPIYIATPELHGVDRYKLVSSLPGDYALFLKAFTEIMDNDSEDQR